HDCNLNLRKRALAARNCSGASTPAKGTTVAVHHSAPFAEIVANPEFLPVVPLGGTITSTFVVLHAPSLAPREPEKEARALPDRAPTKFPRQFVARLPKPRVHLFGDFILSTGSSKLMPPNMHQE
ncbi:MAG TPA: hypothetical protein VKK79_22835, partial [Candidatus Lokiarchaeia archaeon]|nr:hypothetical protein [Candidatus Lokiarchaeia archaeon]